VPQAYRACGPRCRSGISERQPWQALRHERRSARPQVTAALFATATCNVPQASGLYDTEEEPGHLDRIVRGFRRRFEVRVVVGPNRPSHRTHRRTDPVAVSGHGSVRVTGVSRLVVRKDGAGLRSQREIPAVRRQDRHARWRREGRDRTRNTCRCGSHYRGVGKTARGTPAGFRDDSASVYSHANHLVAPFRSRRETLGRYEYDAGLGPLSKTHVGARPTCKNEASIDSYYP
jgi:hypothetical protein